MGSFNASMELNYPNNHGTESIDFQVLATEDPKTAAEAMIKAHQQQVQDAESVTVKIDGKVIDVQSFVNKYRNTEG